jgi:hypothetical protein
MLVTEPIAKMQQVKDGSGNWSISNNLPIITKVKAFEKQKKKFLWMDGWIM